MRHPPHLSPAGSSSRSTTPTSSPKLRSSIDLISKGANSKTLNSITSSTTQETTTNSPSLPDTISNPPTSLIATDSSESPVISMPKLIPLASSSSTSSMSSYAASASSSDSETYVNDLGGPVVQDLTSWNASIPRLQIQRTYSSSSSSCTSSSSSSPRRARHSINNFQDDSNDWGIAADDMLSLEDLQIQADDISTAIEEIPTSLGKVDYQPSGEWEAGEPPPKHEKLNKDDWSSHHNQLNDTKTIEVVIELDNDEQNSIHQMVNEDVIIPNHIQNGLVIKEPCDRVESITKRIDNVVSELASLQLQTADRAAEADAQKGDKRAPDAPLREQVKQLRNTLDTLARICLQKAFQVRDEVESHR